MKPTKLNNLSEHLEKKFLRYLIKKHPQTWKNLNFILTILYTTSGKYPWEKEPPYPPSYRLNSTTTVLLGECLWH